MIFKIYIILQKYGGRKRRIQISW